VSLGETTFNGQQTLAEVLEILREHGATRYDRRAVSRARAPGAHRGTDPCAAGIDRPGQPDGPPGLDSLQLIILRERLESSLAVVFSDEEWMALDTPASVLARVSSQMGGPRRPR
jgi:acyl carrier protein